MAKTITATVGGMGGVNRPQDVRVVQELLNKVPTKSGGPARPLIADGSCGQKTIAAIRNFQTSNFGPSGATGRVDPIGQTIDWLNEFDPAAGPNPYPALTTASVMTCPHGGRVQAVLIGMNRVLSPRNGQPLLRASDTFVIAGCPFSAGYGKPSPCVRVNWVSGPTDPLDRRSVGLCMSTASVPQGPATIVVV